MVKDEKTGGSYNRHEGTDEKFPEQKVTVAFLEFFDWSEETKEILQDRMSPDHVVFMHLPRRKKRSRRSRVAWRRSVPTRSCFASRRRSVL